MTDVRTHGSFRHVQIPRSSIYISGNVHETETKQKYQFESDVTAFHFVLILKCGLHYAAEDLICAQGKYSCFNCVKPILQQIYFYPEEFDCLTNETTLNPIPHCSPECTLRTVSDLSSNADLLSMFTLMYGFEIECAPPRFLAFLPVSVKQPSKIRYQFKNEFKFFMTEDLYDPADVVACQEKYACYNCSCKITGQIYFYPEYFDHQTNEPTCNIIPHCGAPCLYRTLQNVKNNIDLLTNLFLMYGHEIHCAPERFLLFIPGGLTLEKYQKVINDRLLIQKQEKCIRGLFACIYQAQTLFENHQLLAEVDILTDDRVSVGQQRFSSVYLSCSLIKDHQLVPDTVAFIDELQIEKKHTIGPSRNRNNADLKVVELRPRKLTETKLNETFEADPDSFNRTEALKQNPHM